MTFCCALFAAYSQAERAAAFAATHIRQQPGAVSSHGSSSVLPPLHIYTAAFAASLEAGGFQGAVAREGGVFADLIRSKQHLVLPQDLGQNTLQQVCGGGWVWLWWWWWIVVGKVGGGQGAMNLSCPVLAAHVWQQSRRLGAVVWCLQK